MTKGNTLCYPLRMSRKEALWQRIQQMTLDRNQQILKCKQQNPHLSLQEIAEFFGISRQRVWQILKKYKTLEEKNESNTISAKTTNYQR